MNLLHRYIYCFTTGTRILLFTLLISMVTFGCNPPNLPPAPPPADSLLHVTPIADMMPEEGDEPFTTQRAFLNGLSIECWIPPDGATSLRFPVELRDSARFSFCIGIETTVAMQVDDIFIRVEYVRHDMTSVDTSSPIEPVILYETTLRQIPECLSEWVFIDLSLEAISPSSGEIRLVTDGKLAADDRVDVMWGQPTIYYPNEMRRKNVLLIGVDTLRRDALSIYGGRNEISPNIDLLTDNAVIFERAWSQAPYTGPSFASMLSGLYPSGNSPTLARVHLPAQVDTIAERLIEQGFATHFVCSNPYLGTYRSGFHQGSEGLWYGLQAPPHTTVEQAVEFIGRTKERDWFLFLHFIDPHGPYDPPIDLIEKLCDSNYSGRYEREYSDMRTWRLSRSIPDEREVNRVHELYEAEVADVDIAIGNLFAYLDDNNLLEDTLIIFAADHGEEFYEHERYGHGQSLYDEMVHLPLMVWGDGFTPGIRSDSLTANVDIVPTILKYTGTTIPDDLPGYPLQDILSTNAGRDRVILGEGNLRQSFHHKFAVDWPYKVIVNYFTGETKLYNLEDDPGELNNLIDTMPSVAESLTKEITLKLLPMQTTFVVTLIGDPSAGHLRYSGAIEIPGGFAALRTSGVLHNDTYEAVGENISFNFDTRTDAETPFKSLIITPNPGGDAITIRVMADGRPDPTILYPYGTDQLEPSGTATVNVHDFPWPNRLPSDAPQRPAAFYIIGIPGLLDFAVEYEDDEEIDAETREGLRALGYFN